MDFKSDTGNSDYTHGLASFYSVDAMRADAALRTARTRMVTALPGTPAVEDSPAEWSANMYGDYTGGDR